MDHTLVINHIMEKSAEYNQRRYIAFIDHEKAFDSVEMPAVIEALRDQGVQEAYANTLINIYKDFTATLVLHKKIRKLPIRKVIRQGDTISRMLFPACLEEVFKPLAWKGLGVRINGEYLGNLRFADDILRFSNAGDEFQQVIEDLDRESVRVGLKINMQKTKIMFNSPAAEHEFRIATQPVGPVQQYVYLNQLFTGDSDHEKEICRRIKLGWSAYGRHCEILTGILPMSLKIKVYNHCISPVVT